MTAPARFLDIHDVIELLDALSAVGIEVWVDGGWGVDALLGEQTRPHSDLDVVIDMEQVSASQLALRANGYDLSEDELPTRFVMRDEHGRQIDFHPVTFDAHGSGWQAQPEAPSFEYTAAGLAGKGVIAGRAVRCLSAELQLTTHLAYEPDDDDRHDMQLLCARFGLTLPDIFRA